MKLMRSSIILRAPLYSDIKITLVFLKVVPDFIKKMNVQVGSRKWHRTFPRKCIIIPSLGASEIIFDSTASADWASWRHLCSFLYAAVLFNASQCLVRIQFLISFSSGALVTGCKTFSR